MHHVQVHHTLETQATRLNEDALQLAVAKNCIGCVTWNVQSTESTCTCSMVDQTKTRQLHHRCGDSLSFVRLEWIFRDEAGSTLHHGGWKLVRI